MTSHVPDIQFNALGTLWQYTTVHITCGLCHATHLYIESKADDALGRMLSAGWHKSPAHGWICHTCFNKDHR